MSTPIIGRLEALLARVQRRAQDPRVHHVFQTSNETVAPPSIQTVPPSPDARAAIAQEMNVTTPPPPAVLPVATVAPLEAESHSQLVAARGIDEPLTDEEVLELDDRHVVGEEATIDVIDEDEPPPSSRRHKPLDEVPKPEVPHPAPPESGRQIAAQELSFEDDLTGVREARKDVPPEPELEHDRISLQSVEPAVQATSPNSMEMDIPTLGAPGAFTPEVVALPLAAPPPAASQVQVIRAELREVEVAQVSGVLPVSFEPKTFGELLDATLAL